ncbi:MAG: metallophosphoesterase [Sulfolobales archaeon]|nr:metallophosphoesterase [Sulfolobales archaeon]
MKVLALSDVHGNWRNLRKVLESEGYDMVLIAGDLSDYGGKVDKVVEVLSTYMKSSGKAAFVVLGNMDNPKLLKELSNVEGVILLHGSVTKMNSYLIAGVSGSLHSPFHTYFELSDDDYRKLLDSIIKELGSYNSSERLILLTHTPPYNTKLDLTYDGLHVGSESLRKFVEHRKPIITVCGHIHEGRGVDNINGSLILNPGPLFRGFYATVDLGNEVLCTLKSIM